MELGSVCKVTPWVMTVCKLELTLFPPKPRVFTDAGRDWGQEEKGTTEDEMAGWHHGLDGRESE